MEQPILIYRKNAEKKLNKVVIPKIFTDRWGKEFIMEVYEDYIKLKPLKKEISN